MAKKRTRLHLVQPTFPDIFNQTQKLTERVFALEQRLRAAGERGAEALQTPGTRIGYAPAGYVLLWRGMTITRPYWARECGNIGERLVYGVRESDCTVLGCYLSRLVRV